MKVTPLQVELKIADCRSRNADWRRGRIRVDLTNPDNYRPDASVATGVDPDWERFVFLLECLRVLRDSLFALEVLSLAVVVAVVMFR
jgi:hypothetical protein